MECPYYQDIRDAHPEAIEHMSYLPYLTAHFGIALDGPPYTQHRWELEATKLPEPPNISGYKLRKIFTDGSAGPANDARWRLAGFGVVDATEGEEVTVDPPEL